MSGRSTSAVVPPFVLQQRGRQLNRARGSVAAWPADHRVNVANASVPTRFVHFVRPAVRSTGPIPIRAIDNYAEIAWSAALAQQTRDQFFQRRYNCPGEGLGVTLKQALEFDHITAPMSVADRRGCSIFSIGESKDTVERYRRSVSRSRRQDRALVGGFELYQLLCKSVIGIPNSKHTESYGLLIPGDRALCPNWSNAVALAR
jgi:hypothetical protein